MTARMYIWPRYVLEIDGKRVRFPDKSGACIARLFRAVGHFVPRDELIDAIWHDDPEGGPLCASNCVSVYMHRINKLLAPLDARIEGFPWKGSRLLIGVPKRKGKPKPLTKNAHRFVRNDHRSIACSPL